MKKGKTSTAEIIYDEQNHLVVISPFEGATIDAKEYIEQYHKVVELTGGVSSCVLILTSPFLNVTKAAREESLKPEWQKYTIAQAIVVNNLANRILGNFYIKVMRPKVPNKLFSNEAEAKKWLQLRIAQYYGKK
jgi:hypothetical protein